MTPSSTKTLRHLVCGFSFYMLLWWLMPL